jgi:hypothetical protein
MSGVITLGAEIEYATRPGTNTHYIISRQMQELDLEFEYYPHMVEYNDILVSAELSINGIEIGLNRIRKKIENKAIELKRYLNQHRPTWRVYISAIPFAKYDGLIWNGLHLHLGKIFKVGDIRYVRALAVYWKHKHNPDFRFLTSHHLWGSLRSSSYSFKQKPKFKPVIRTSHNTTEFRLFAFEDIKVKQLRKELAKFLYTLIKYYSETSNNWFDEVCDKLEWISSSVVDTYRFYKNFSCEYIPVNISYTKEYGRTCLTEEINGEKYSGRLFVATNVGDDVKVVRRLVENLNLHSL